MPQTQKTILFQGDSITDCGRTAPNGDPLGGGYVKVLSSRMPQLFPETAYTIHNRGISGNRVTDLQARWQTDAVELRPDILSILIGVNDVWHGLSTKPVYAGVPTDHYKSTYHDLLEHTLKLFPTIQLVLCEPFLLKGSAYTTEFEDTLAERRAIVADLAKQFDTMFVPFQSVLEHALTEHSVDALAPDGVHPSPLGHACLADAWLAACEGKLS